MLNNLAEHKRAVYLTAGIMFLISLFMSVDIQTQEEPGHVTVKAISLFGPFIILLCSQALKRCRGQISRPMIYSISSLIIIVSETLITKLMSG